MVVSLHDHHFGIDNGRVSSSPFTCICTTLRTVCRLPPPPITSHPPLITLPPPFLLSGSRFRRKALRSTLPRRKARRQPHSHVIPPPSPRRSPARPPFPSRPRPTSVSVAAASRRTPTLALRPTSVSVAVAPHAYARPPPASAAMVAKNLARTPIHCPRFAPSRLHPAANRKRVIHGRRDLRQPARVPRSPAAAANPTSHMDGGDRPVSLCHQTPNLGETAANPQQPCRSDLPANLSRLDA
jgi:hypothetical protein